MDIPQISQEENEFLIGPFIKFEVRNTIFQMEHNKAPGPNGFPAKFYQVFWGIIKDDLLPLFADLHREALDLYSLNFGIITLIPKIHNATCHTRLSEENQVQTYMHARIKFHAYSDI
jgi:hypothetical protein